ncbi:MAG: PAS domain S-box protein [Armatimonadetes bacterium]|nr:PAS domain S-box protein [Armatimonadota bacterium]
MTRSPLMRYGIAMLASLAALSLTLLLFPLIWPMVSPFLFAAAVFSAWYGGLGPGLLAAFVSGAGTGFYLLLGGHPFPLNAPDVVRVVSFASATFLVVWLSAGLRQANLTLRALIEASPLAIFTLTPEGTVVSWNAAAERMFGWPRGEVLGRYLPIVPPEKENEFRRLRESALQGRSLIGVEVRRLRRDGSAIDVSISTAPIGGDRGRVPRIMGVVADITERRRAQDALQAREEVLRLFVEHTPAAVAMLDREMRYVHVSRRWLADYDLGDRSIIGRSHYEVFPEVRVQQKEVHRRCLAGESARCDEDSFRRKSGKLEWCRWEILPWRTDDGDIGGLILFTEVITRRKEMEEELRKARRQAEEAYQREHRIARRFQSALMVPDEVCVPGYAVAHTYRPALVEADVGGDFYNLFHVDDRRVGVVIGDVGGKGLEAAVIAARVQHSILALAMQERYSPARVLDGVRAVAATFGDPEVMVTLFFGILDRETGALTYASAGHGPTLIWRQAEGRVQALMPDGPAICGLPAGPHTARETSLGEGDTLFLHTDGLADARHGSHVLGWERIERLLAGHSADEPAEILEAMYRAAVAHSRGHLCDDIALVALRRLAADQTPTTATWVYPPRMSRRLDTGQPGRHRG